MRYFFLVFYLSLCLFLLFSCAENKPTIEEIFPQKIDLMSSGMPIQMQVPADAEVVDDSDSFLQDVKIKGSDFYVQIYSQTARSLDCSTLSDEQKLSLKTENQNFKKIITEEPCGFVYAVQVPGDTTECYNFEYYRVQGDKSYRFTSTTSGLKPFSLQAIENMFAAVKAQQ